jgi:transcriptional regulator MraZ
LKVDGEGRVVLSDPLKTHASITDAATFVGLGHKFQIWEPQRFRAHLAQATATLRAARRFQEAGPNPQGARE